jgi:hypothetical protein
VLFATMAVMLSVAIWSLAVHRLAP